MNDEMKNKSGKVKVMYVRSDDDSDKRTQNPRTGKVAGVRRLLVQTVAVAPPAMTKIPAVMTANVTIANAMTVRVPTAHVMTVHATIVRVMTSHAITPHRGAPFLALLAMTRQKKPITAVSAVELYRPGSAAPSACGRDPRVWRECLSGPVPESS